jgi:hypothetical protein
MGNLANALQQLRAERQQEQLHVGKLDKAIAVIESLNGTGTSQKASQPTGITSASASPSAPKRFISKASRLKMARAQRARWAKIRKEGQAVLVEAAKTSAPAQAKRIMSPSARKKIAAFQRARWAKLRAGQKKAA